MNELTQRGINALKANDRASARKLLAAALQQDQNDATAWLWLAAAVDTPGQRVDCLRQVLKIDPTNQAALKGLAALEAPAAGTQAQGANVPSASPAQPVAGAAVPQSPPNRQPAAPARPLTNEELRALADEGFSDELGSDSASESDDTDAVSTSTHMVAESAPASVDTGSAPASTNTLPEAAPANTSAPYTGPVVGYRPPVRVEDEEADARKIFKVRPSNVPALLSFWVFFFGALIVNSQINAIKPDGVFQSEGFLEGMPIAVFGMLFALVLGLLLEIVVLYVVIRNMRTHYELTSASLSLPFRGRPTRIPIRDIYHAVCHQTSFQRLYGAGDLQVDAAVQGELAHVRLRNIPGCHKRAEEIAYLIQDNAA
jgi:hypothetical protein